MSSITEYRTAILTLLDDAAGARYTSDLIDRALRLALREYDRLHPNEATYNMDGNGERVIELPADFQPASILRVEVHTEGECPQPRLRFNAYTQDGQWFIELMDRSLSASESIDVTYTNAHTIDGLDEAAGTSVRAEHENAVQMGAAGFAALMRAASRAETVNLQPGLSRSLLELSAVLLRDFRAAIRKDAGAVFATWPVVRKGIV
jgi:hypothetical protein